MNDKSMWILLDSYNSVIHNKLILVLLKPCYFSSPTPPLPYLFFKISVTAIIPVSLAENLDSPYTFPSSFLPPTLMHQIPSVPPL